MIYTPLTKAAMEIAYRAHHGQLDKSGVPYIFHPIHLAEQMDDEVSCCAALLHDVDDRKLSPETYQNQTHARNFLRENGVEVDAIEHICQIIREISFGANDAAPTTKEGQCVQDADRLDAIGAIGIARAFAYGGHHNREMHSPNIKPNLNMTKEEYAKSESTTVNHFYEKLFKLTAFMNTPTAIQLAQARDAYMQAFLAEFMDEWEGVR